jgi:hypothetical protein
MFKKYFLLANFETRGDGRRHPSGNSNNRTNDGFRQGGRNSNNYNQQEPSENVEDGYNNGMRELKDFLIIDFFFVFFV